VAHCAKQSKKLELSKDEMMVSSKKTIPMQAENQLGFSENAFSKQ